MAADYTGRKGRTLYVSKLGDDSDGSSWAKAFRTIQAALSVVAEGGGHRIIVRPDHYNEANLHPAQPGAPGAYNLLAGDFDGSLGSGTNGWVLIDSSDPTNGFKSWDWWGPIAASDKKWPTGNNQRTFSSIVCDRWIFRNLYTAGGDAGLFWDLTDKSGQGFTVVVEDCVGTGRAFGGGVCYPDGARERAERFSPLLLPGAGLGGRHGGGPVGRLGKVNAQVASCPDVAPTPSPPTI